MAGNIPRPSLCNYCGTHCASHEVTPLFVHSSYRFEALHLRVWILGGAQEEISGFEAQILTDSADQVCLWAGA